MPEREFPDLQGGCQVRLDLGLKKKKKPNSWVPWLTPVIPATQEAEIRRIVV
jgi:hypothetical protein